MENNDKIETSANQQNTKKPISFLEKIKRNKAIIEKAKNYKTHVPANDVAISVQHLTMIFKSGKGGLKVADDDLILKLKKVLFMVL